MCLQRRGDFLFDMPVSGQQRVLTRDIEVREANRQSALSAFWPGLMVLSGAANLPVCCGYWNKLS